MRERLGAEKTKVPSQSRSELNILILTHNYIRFREILRQDPEVREQYARLKAELEAKYTDDRPSYTASKHDFIRSILGMERKPYKAPDFTP